MGASGYYRQRLGYYMLRHGYYRQRHGYYRPRRFNQIYIFSCHPGSVYVMYVCMCVGYECVSSILYVVMHDYISSFEVPSSRFQEFL